MTPFDGFDRGCSQAATEVSERSLPGLTNRLVPVPERQTVDSAEPSATLSSNRLGLSNFSLGVGGLQGFSGSGVQPSLV